MKSIFPAVLTGAFLCAAFVKVLQHTEFFQFLENSNFSEDMFNYVQIWIGALNYDTETETAYALLDGLGVRANPAAAIALACSSTTMDDFDVSKILVQGNLRLARKDFHPIRCSEEKQ